MGHDLRVMDEMSELVLYDVLEPHPDHGHDPPASPQYCSGHPAPQSFGWWNATLLYPACCVGVEEKPHFLLQNLKFPHRFRLASATNPLTMHCDRLLSLPPGSSWSTICGTFGIFRTGAFRTMCVIYALEVREQKHDKPGAPLTLRNHLPLRTLGADASDLLNHQPQIQPARRASRRYLAIGQARFSRTAPDRQC